MAIHRPASFGDSLKRYRVAAGLTQEALAERAGLSARGISDLERGRRTRPYYDTVRLLADALGLTSDERQALIAAARAAGSVEAPLGSVDARTPVPVPLTPLVGRDDDVSAVGQLLDRAGVRLVSLTGPGGVGKTRLALQVAAEWRSRFPDGVCFVSLAALRDPNLVVTTIAHAVGLRNVRSETALAALTAQLSAKRLLLVVDNFEHLLVAAPLLTGLLAACPQVRVLATSRALLHLTGEHEYVVPPLALPDPRQPADLDRLRSSPAATLLLERLAATSPRSTVSEDDVPAITEICVRTDGLPLAIELAAARARHLALPELATRLQRRLPVLTRGPRDLPPRQQTLRDTIAWSYDLLSPEEQRLLRWLAVFSGGWTVDGAEALGRGDDDSSIDVVDGLAALVESSLVQVERGAAGRARYGMLESIREFAEERLDASGEAEAVRRRHADVLLDFTERAWRGLTSGERTAWSRAVPAELDNVRAALGWSLDHSETERALRMVGNLEWFWDALGSEREGWTWSQAALAKENADRDGWGYARALYAAGELAWNLGDFSQSFELVSASVARLRVLGDRPALALALLQLGLTAFYLGDPAAARENVQKSIAILEAIDDPWNYGLAVFALGELTAPDDVAAARACYERSLAVYRSIGDSWGIAHALTGLGGLAMRERDYRTARALFEEGLQLRRSVNNPGAIATSLVSLGELARREGDDARAVSHLEEGLSRVRASNDAEHVAWALYNLGMVAVQRGNTEAAAPAFAECLALRVAQGNPAQIAKAIAAVARVAVMRGDAERAAQLWGAVEAVRAEQRVTAPTDEDGAEEQLTVDLLSAALGAAAASDACARGRSLTLAEAITLASETLGPSFRG